MPGNNRLAVIFRLELSSFFIAITILSPPTEARAETTERPPNAAALVQTDKKVLWKSMRLYNNFTKGETA